LTDTLYLDGRNTNHRFRSFFQVSPDRPFCTIIIETNASECGNEIHGHGNFLSHPSFRKYLILKFKPDVHLNYIQTLSSYVTDYTGCSFCNIFIYCENYDRRKSAAWASVEFFKTTADGTYTRGADKSLARPERKQTRMHVRDARDFNNIETRAVIKFFFLQRKAPKEIHTILTESRSGLVGGK